MEKNRRPIMVTWDFSEVAEYAAAHAAQLAKKLNTDYGLLHIVKKEKEIPVVKQKMAPYIAKLTEKHGIKPLEFIREGSIFTTISEVAAEERAELIIMGTHGIKGMQKLTGSWALKVIAKTKPPFIVVQKPPEKESIETVVVPIDFKKENKEKTSWLYFLHNLYKPKFYLFKTRVHDKTFVKGLNSNMVFIKKFMDTNDLVYEEILAPGKKDHAHEAVEFAKEKDTDLMLVSTTKDIGLTDYVLGASEQYILANPHEIPVMCFNPKKTKKSGGFSATGG